MAIISPVSPYIFYPHPFHAPELRGDSVRSVLGPLQWAEFSDALQYLPELQVLKLSNFPDPDTVPGHRISSKCYNSPRMPEIDVGLHFSYQDAIQNAPFQWNIHFVWNSQVSDSDLLAITDAVSEIRHLETLESLLIYKCDVLPQGYWLTLLRHLDCVQTLIVGSCPAPGMFWDLPKHAEDPRNSPPLLPMLRTIALIGVDFSLGGWMP
ncbi:hypothetical protein B0H10DRAFT_2266268 [Mycena sp. CBHHK59/15]|nr:hypothetical protein B0H10DRAFT_2266268 [Mycena sp. CBHHK59/15]